MAVSYTTVLQELNISIFGICPVFVKIVIRRLFLKEEMKDLPNYKVKLFERDSILNNLMVKTRQFIERFYIGL